MGDDAYEYFNGTSMATPHVAGIAAVVMGADPSLTAAEVRQRLQDTAQDLGATGRDDDFGYGFVDALAATAGVPDPVCGDGTCASGESCVSCLQDCPGKATGKPSSLYCCGNGTLEGPEGDGTIICDGNP